MVSFGDLSSAAGLQKLDGHLLKNTYVDKYDISKSDVETFRAVASRPAAGKYPNAARWFDMVNSYSAMIQDLLSGAEGKQAAPAKAAKKTDDDDFDFSSEDEAAAPSRRPARAPPAPKPTEKAKKPKEAAKSSLIFSAFQANTDNKFVASEVFAEVKKIAIDGLVWGKMEEIDGPFGIKGIKGEAIIEDDKVTNTDDIWQAVSTVGLKDEAEKAAYLKREAEIEEGADDLTEEEEKRFGSRLLSSPTLISHTKF